MNRTKFINRCFCFLCFVVILTPVQFAKGKNINSNRVKSFSCSEKTQFEAKLKSGQILSVKEMLEDLDLLHKILLESHPNLYRAITAKATERNWRKTRMEIKKPLSPMQFLNILNPLVSGYNDGHTYLDLPLESDEYKEYVKNGGLFFPFRVWLKDNRLFVTESLGTLALPKGTEILNINGKSAKNINRDLFSAMVGDSAASKFASVERLFGLVLWQRTAQTNNFKLEIRRPHQQKRENVAAAGISPEQFTNNLFSDKAVKFYELTPQIAVLEINKMQSNDAVKKQIDEAFAHIREKNYPSLIVDIRRNGGGNSVVANWVFGYLTERPFRHSDVKEIRLSPYLIENNKFFREFTTKLKENNPVEGDKIILKSDDDGEAVKKANWIYDGKVYLLTAPRTYSSAFMMAETFKCYKLGTMIGEMPGSYRNLTGELMQFRLPNSKLVGYVSTSQFFPPCYQKAKTDFLAPDVKVEQTYDDLIAGRDTILEYIKNEQQKSLK